MDDSRPAATDGSPAPPAAPGGPPAPRTVPEVLDTLRSLQVSADATPPLYANDGVASFNYLYTIITNDVLDKLDQRDYFEDNEWLAALDVVFASRYLRALWCYQTHNGETPSSWSLLFDRRSNRRISPIQFAVAGVNAHVNYDLAFAVVATCQTLEVDLDSGAHHRDYQKINAIFAEHMRRLREHFEDRVEREVDTLVAGLADRIDQLIVVGARDVAWSRACQLWPLRGDPAAIRQAEHCEDALVTLAAHGLLAPLAL